MEENFKEKIIDYLWLKPLSLLILPSILIIGGMPFWPSEVNPSFLKLKLYCVATISISIFIIYAILTYNNNKLPRVKTDKAGILIIVDAENKKQFEDIKNKFIDKFNDIIRNSSINNFSIIYVSIEKLSRYDLLEKDSLIKLLKRVNCIYSIKIKMLADDDNDATNYQIIINNGILHPEYKENIQKQFESELNFLTSFVGKKKFKKQDKIEELEVTALHLAYVCKYIIGTTGLLGSSVALGKIMFEELYAEIEKNSKNIHLINHLKHVLPIRCYEVNYILASLLYKEYRKTKNTSTLEEMHKLLENANMFIPNTYNYFMMMAIYYVCSNSDIQKSRKCIAECSVIKQDNIWRYNDAFLYAYEGTAFLTIYKKYKQAFKTDYDLLELASFIEDVLEKYPEKSGLYFALGMIYSELGNISKAAQNFKTFSTEYSGNEESKEKLKDIINERLDGFQLLQAV